MTQRPAAVLGNARAARRFVAPAALLLGAVLIPVAVVFFARAQGASVVAQQFVIPTPSTLVYLDPPTQTVLARTDVVLDVRINDVTNLGAYEISFGTVLNLVSVTNGPFLGSAGRSPLCFLGQEDVNIYRFGCVTEGSGAAPSGSGLLATVRLGTSCAGTSAVPLLRAVLSDALGNKIPTRVQGGSATVTGNSRTCLGASVCADVDGDGRVRVTDVLYVVSVYGSSDPTADFDNDGAITITDILFVVTAYGSNC